MDIDFLDCVAFERPESKQLRSRVLEVDRTWVRLKCTNFYPGMSGQPADRGYLSDLSTDRRFPIDTVEIRDGKIWHKVVGEPPAEGSKVLCGLDWPRRYFFMRAHTAAVLVSGLAWRAWCCRVTSCDITEDRVRLDFDLRIQGGQVEWLIQAANSRIAEELPVTWSYISTISLGPGSHLLRSKASDPSTMGLRARIVTIGEPAEPLEQQCDVGTHVSNLREIGAIALGKDSPDQGAVRATANKGRHHFRLYFRVLQRTETRA
jgi:misacylated tRNA(Ala) deacylase